MEIGSDFQDLIIWEGVVLQIEAKQTEGLCPVREKGRRTPFSTFGQQEAPLCFRFMPSYIVFVTNA
jgi:hypothetical protein